MQIRGWWPTTPYTALLVHSSLRSVEPGTERCSINSGAESRISSRALMTAMSLREVTRGMARYGVQASYEGHADILDWRELARA